MFLKFSSNVLKKKILGAGNTGIQTSSVSILLDWILLLTHSASQPKVQIGNFHVEISIWSKYTNLDQYVVALWEAFRTWLWISCNYILRPFPQVSGGCNLISAAEGGTAELSVCHVHLSVEEQACPRVFWERKQVWKAAVGERQAERGRRTKRSRDRGAGGERDPNSVVSLFHHIPVYINLNINMFFF